MTRTFRVLVTIAIALSALEICALAVDLLEPSQQGSAGASSFAAKAEVRWQVYWFSGALLSAAGLVSRRRYRLAGEALAIGGVYLMILGNNGGLLSSGHVPYRFATSIFTFAFLLVLAVRAEHRSDSREGA